MQVFYNKKRRTKMMLKLPMIFGDGMVLQRQKPIAVWGNAAPAACVQVQLMSSSVLADVKTVADEQGAWCLQLPPMEAARGVSLQISSGGETLVLRDVLIGEVWIAGGQSNMEYVLQFDAEKEQALSKTEQPDIRFFDYPEVSYEGALSEHDYSECGFWRRCRREDLPWFSAVGYYFADKLHEALDVPIGIVGCNWGGTRACCWMAEEYMTGTPAEVWLEEYRKGLQGVDLQQLSRDYRGNPMNISNHPTVDPYGITFPGWSREQQLVTMEQMVLGGQLLIGPDHPWRPCGLYHTMLKNVAPYTAKGVIWYQGESDDIHADIYDTVLCAMMRNWRDLWQDELPFLIVQLAPFGNWLDCSGELYPAVRAQQQAVCDRDENAFLCSISDSGMQWDIHPKHKKPVGQRLALLARGHIYGEDILCDAPRFRDVTVDGTEAVLRFDHAAGLHRTGSEETVPALTVNGQPCTGCVADDTLIIPLPQADEWHIEYANTGYYQADLYNEAGIPALPFTVTVKK